jgi:hypothetical protein
MFGELLILEQTDVVKARISIGIDYKRTRVGTPGEVAIVE